jgi:hypothetical protein
MIEIYLHGKPPVKVSSIHEAQKVLRPYTSCERKVRYGHRESAEQAVEAMRKKCGADLVSYPCTDCMGWHIGHEK